jgi:hypothetical protein
MAVAHDIKERDVYSSSMIGKVRESVQLRASTIGHIVVDVVFRDVCLS